MNKDEGRDDFESRIKEHKKIAELYLLRYDELQKIYSQNKYEALNSTHKGLSTGCSSGQCNSPTEMKALQSAQYDENHDAYYWLLAVKKLVVNFKSRDKKFLELRRVADKHNRGSVGRPGWVEMVRHRYTDYLFENENEIEFENRIISDKTIKQIWRSMIDKVAYVYLISRKK